MASVEVRVEGRKAIAHLERVPVAGDYIVSRGPAVRVTDVAFTPGQNIDAIAIAVTSQEGWPEDLKKALSELESEEAS